MSLKRFPFFLFLLFLISIVLFFSPLPFGEEIKNESLYRKAHCFYTSSSQTDLFLCPNHKSSFFRPDGKVWDLETNEYGERVTHLTKKCDGPKNEIWLIGDSMSMGFLLDQKNSPGQILEDRLKIPVRVMAVDALGTLGILRRFQLGQRHHGQGTVCPRTPLHVFWIWNTSDFLDDTKENQNHTFLRKIAYRIHYFIAKHSLIYLYLRNSNQEFNKIHPEVPLEPYPKDHISFQNLKTFSSYFQKEKIPLTVLYGWGMKKDGTPETEDPNYFHLTKDFQEIGLDPMDLRKEVELRFQKGAKLFVPNDGHPDSDYSLLFAEAMANKFLHPDKP